MAYIVAMTPTRQRTLDQDEISSFTHVGDDILSRVKLIRTNLLPRAADGMTLGNLVLLRGNRIEDRATPLLAHELVHVRQFAELGPGRFLVQYVGAYLKNLLKYRNHRKAYLEIPLEIEARREASEWTEKRGTRIAKPESR